MARPWSMWTAAMAFSAMWVCVWTYTHPTDQEALEMFLDGIEEDPRGYLSSWRGSNDACGDKWMGIECNEDGRVTVLNLHYRCDQWRCDRPVSEGGGPNELVGTISPWVGNLTELRRFHASHNRLYGPLPSTIGRLRHVFELDIDSNDLTGIIPSSFGNIAGLEELDLKYNDLEGSIPSSLGNIAKLEQVQVDHNPRMSGCIPSLSSTACVSVENTGIRRSCTPFRSVNYC